MLQDAVGKVLDRWTIMSREEEVVTLQQFLRFGETKSIVELMALQEQEGHVVTVPPAEGNSGIRTFIESSSPTLMTHLQSNSSNSIHHFENLPNSLAFLLPFQYINPGSAPMLGLPTNSLAREPGIPANGLGREPGLPANGLTREPGLPIQSEQAESSKSEASLSPCPSLGGLGNKLKPKTEFLSAPPASPSPLQLSDHNAQHQLQKAEPRSLMHSGLSCKTHRMRRMGTASRKGRVCCNSCGKTFYDKGTLKIHYNAVHLKIKHRCTVQGCNMVFSSLRSRNRHSANPNPRLHLPVLRNNRDRDLIRSTARSAAPLITGSTRPATAHSTTASPLISPAPTLGLDPLLHGPLVFPTLKSMQPVQPIAPFYHTLLSPSDLINQPVSLPTSATNHTSLTDQPALPPSHTPPPVLDSASDPAPKKKPRKSSMPVKIEKEAISAAHAYEEKEDQDAINRSCSDHIADGDCHAHNHHSNSTRTSVNSGDSCQHSPCQGERSPSPALLWHGLQEYKEMHCRDHGQEGQCVRDTSEVISCDREDSMDTEQEGEQEAEPEMGCEAQQEVKQEAVEGVQQEVEQAHLREEVENRICFSPSLPQPLVSIKEELSDPVFNMLSMGRHGLYRKSLISTAEYALSPSDRDPSSGPHPRTCYVCKKSFKSSYSVKLHYKNVHLKEMHVCTLAGCSAAFPSRRSRDR
ncbi:hypothetical protein JZ751_012581 [Albula glossodonta]|uniref:C2H2-type domain-containing protein n=1 Tax=Albula glossodonta TaxID=121402 RepID=A0A8T2NY88_9TELE|nr:hypothetical protein JZ751_012581 [Albula glossodonta]